MIIITNYLLAICMLETYAPVGLTAQQVDQYPGASYDLAGDDSVHIGGRAKRDGELPQTADALPAADPNSSKLFFPFTAQESEKRTPKRFRSFSGRRKRMSTGCGDGFVNAAEEEECDPGKHGAEDPCCLQNCTLRPLAVCSPTHQVCCNPACQVASAFQQCRSDRDACVTSAMYCNGVDPNTCSTGASDGKSYHRRVTTNAPDLSTCGSGGVCMDGECLPHCTVNGLNLTSESETSLEICECPKSPSGSKEKLNQNDDICIPCCKGNGSAEALCSARRGRLPDGRPCVFALCPERGCVKVENSFTDVDGTPFEIHGSNTKNDINMGLLHEVSRGFYYGISVAMVLAVVGFSLSTAYQVGFKKQTNNDANHFRALSDGQK